jgi:pimeloyl-ACP methyl ester carboxylesterase
MLSVAVLTAFTVSTPLHLMSASETQEETTMSSSFNQLLTPEGPGSVTGAPGLPSGFTDTFTSQYIEIGELRLHAVIGGEGPPLLLVHGWPETWRLLMPTLAQDFTVIAVDQRGIGLSDKPADGYDTATLANDMVALMDTLGYERFVVVGHDTGFTIAYAVAADHSERVDRVVLAEIPGPPLATHSPPAFVPAPVNNRLWHIPFNRVENLPEQLIAGREDIYFGYEFAIQGGNLPDDVIEYYVSLVSNPDSLRGSLAWYRAFDATLAQNAERAAHPLTMPVLAIGGELSYGDHVGEAMTPLASDVQSVVIPGTGHWVAEEAPDEMLAALTTFLTPYREGAAVKTTP